MCHFITGTIPKDVKSENIKEILREFRMNFSILRNNKIIQQIPDDLIYIQGTNSYCDCGTSLGSSHRGEIDFNTNLESEEKKFVRKGWSQSKIERWKRDKLKARENMETQNKKESGIQSGFGEFKGGSELSHWLLFIEKMLFDGRCSSVGLLLHWYSGSILTEKFSIKNIVRNRLINTNDEFLKEIEEDVLYLISK